jgi:hypothetical protein
MEAIYNASVGESGLEKIYQEIESQKDKFKEHEDKLSDPTMMPMMILSEVFIKHKIEFEPGAKYWLVVAFHHLKSKGLEKYFTDDMKALQKECE